MADQIEIEILPDGTIKTSTDRVSMPNHATAEAFLRDMARLAGGQVKRERKQGVVHTYAHHHGHEHHHH